MPSVGQSLRTSGASQNSCFTTFSSAFVIVAEYVFSPVTRRAFSSNSSSRITFVRFIHTMCITRVYWSTSTRRSRSSACCVEYHFMIVRGPCQSSLRCSWPFGPATATCTVPTGFSGVPPVGPAMPVMPTPQVAPKRSRMPRGHRDGHRLGDFAVLANERRIDAGERGLRRAGVADAAAEEVGGAAGDVGDAGAEEAAGAGFGDGQGLAARAAATRRRRSPACRRRSRRRARRRSPRSPARARR